VSVLGYSCGVPIDVSLPIRPMILFDDAAGLRHPARGLARELGESLDDAACKAVA
jgi:hypothetical protein